MRSLESSDRYENTPRGVQSALDAISTRDDLHEIGGHAPEVFFLELFKNKTVGYVEFSELLRMYCSENNILLYDETPAHEGILHIVTNGK